MKYFLLFLSTIAFAQQTKKVDFKTANAYLTFDVPQKKVMGKVTYTFEVLDKKTDTIFIDAKNMQFTDVTINKKKAAWIASANALKLYKGFKKGKNTVEFSYTAQPKQTLYFVKDGDDVQLWTQGQGKYTSHWLPSFDDVNEKVVFNISPSFDKNYTVLSNGILKDKTVEGSNQKWAYQMEKPMSSYLVMLAIGKYKKWDMATASGTPLEFYLRDEDSDMYATTYRYSKEIFDFFENEIGYNYPWKVYRQVPVIDFLYAGMENTTSTIFAQDFVVDETGFNDRTYTNVNAHELAHQWFGDVVTAQSGKHHWLQEGFATYYALLAEQKLFGDDHFNYELYQIAERLQVAAKSDTIPVMNEKASSLSFYQKGAWALHVLREGVGYNDFRKAVKSYLEKYAFSNVNTDEFLAEVNKVSTYDTNSWKKRWLETGGFEVDEAIALLKKNESMGLYLEMGELQDNTFAQKKEAFITLLKSDAYYALKEEAIYQTAEVPFEEKAEFVRLAMQSNDVKLRQAVARTVTNFPVSFVDEYKTFLYDASYITREIAINVLCRNFPDRQTEFLEIGKDWVGFNDKNLRILWLTWAYTSKNYRNSEKESFYSELESYAAPEYESGIRTNALSNLLYIGKPDPVVLKNLVSATLHHKWQFVKFGKDNIRKLLKKVGYREHFEELLASLPEAEKKSLERLLAEK
ncbi:M1 family metallopeptidase [Flavobacterium hauense]